MDKHFFTMMIGKRMISWSYLMLLTIRKLELYMPSILQIEDPRSSRIALFPLCRHSISSSRIDLFPLESLSTLGIGESLILSPCAIACADPISTSIRIIINRSNFFTISIIL